MTYVLFLDDERDYRDYVDEEDLPITKVARSVAEAMTLIEEHGMPEFIHFDWYLGVGVFDGMFLVHWLGHRFAEGVYKIPQRRWYDCHSINDEMRMKMQRELHSLTHRFYTASVSIV